MGRAFKKGQDETWALSWNFAAPTSAVNGQKG